MYNIDFRYYFKFVFFRRYLVVGDFVIGFVNLWMKKLDIELVI